MSDTSVPPPVAVTSPLLRRIRLHTGLLTLLVLGLGLWQANDLGLTTDEATYIESIDRIENWVAGFRNNGFFGNLTREKLEAGFSSGEFYNKNPPLISLIGYNSHLMFGSFISPPMSYRMLHVIFFALTCGLIFRWLSTTRFDAAPQSERPESPDYQPAAGLLAVATLIGAPRVQSHAALMSLDPLVGCLWIWGTWLVTRKGQNWWQPVLFSVVVGIGFASKPTFWFMIPIWCLWGLVFRRKEAWKFAASLCTVGLLTSVVCIPAWWDNPAAGFFRYLKLISSDGGWSGIDTYYRGKIYQLNKSEELPWHAVPVMMLVTTPVWILMLWCGGLYRWVRQEFRVPEILLFVCGFLLLPVIVMLPGTPGHDGVRMFLPSYFFGALLGGRVGDSLLRFALNWLQEEVRFRLPKAGTVAAILIIAALIPVWRIHPVGLSYYNFVVGGLPGGTAAGQIRRDFTLTQYPWFEITYWWDPMTKSAWKDLQTHFKPGEKVWIFPDFVGKKLLQRWGIINRDVQFVPVLDEADTAMLYGRMGQLCRPEAFPMSAYFFRPDYEWELRLHNVRFAVAFRSVNRKEPGQEGK